MLLFVGIVSPVIFNVKRKFTKKIFSKDIKPYI